MTIVPGPPPTSGVRGAPGACSSGETRRDAGRPEVVEAPEDVVEVARQRLEEVLEPRLDDLARRQPAQQAPLEQALLATTPRGGHFGRTTGCPLEL